MIFPMASAVSLGGDDPITSGHALSNIIDAQITYETARES